MEDFFWNAGFFLIPLSALGFLISISLFAYSSIKKKNKLRKISLVSIILCVMIFGGNIFLQDKIQEKRIFEDFYDGEGIPIGDIVGSVNSDKY